MVSLLYYAHVVDPTLLKALTIIASEQVNATKYTKKALIHLLDYCAIPHDAPIQHHPLAMILYIHSDMSYLGRPGAKSWVRGHIFLGLQPDSMHPIHLKGVIHVFYTLQKLVADSVAEAGLIMYLILHELDYPQPQMPVHYNNLTTARFQTL